MTIGYTAARAGVGGCADGIAVCRRMRRRNYRASADESPDGPMKLPSVAASNSELPELVDAADAVTVPNIPQMDALAKIQNELRPVDREALPTGVPHAVVDDPVGAAVFQ